MLTSVSSHGDMTFWDMKKRWPTAADAFERLLRDEQDGSLPYDMEAWNFYLDSDGITLRAEMLGERWKWQDPDWVCDND
jgi:hypothetical protein